MKIKKLTWEFMEGHFGRNHIAMIPIGDPYFIWSTDDGFKVSTPPPYKSHSIHGSLDAAKEYCQKDFEKKITDCFEDNFEKWRYLISPPSPNQKIDEQTLREIYNVMDKEENNK